MAYSNVPMFLPVKDSSHSSGKTICLSEGMCNNATSPSVWRSYKTNNLWYVENATAAKKPRSLAAKVSCGINQAWASSWFSYSLVWDTPLSLRGGLTNQIWTISLITCGMLRMSLPLKSPLSRRPKFVAELIRGERGAGVPIL